METRSLLFGSGPTALVVDGLHPGSAEGWTWIDVEAGVDDVDALVDLADELGLDNLAVRDTVEDLDLPKVDDFGTSMLVVLHALGEDRIETYEVDCFVTTRQLVTIHQQRSPSIDVLWDGVQRQPALAGGEPGDLLGRLADVATRRLVSVLDVFDARNEELVQLALRADPAFLGEITAVRADLATVRRSVHPQREVFDVLRRAASPLLTDDGRRRFSDVFDAASRATHGVDAARTALAETLDAYRGAEARQATEVSKVLTVYAAIMLPLSLVTGFFGMNFVDMPLVDREGGWIVVAAFMGLVAVLSLGVFIALGWIRRPSGRGAGVVLGQGLVEAARAPVQLVSAVFEISTMPIRTGSKGRRPKRDPSPDNG